MLVLPSLVSCLFVCLSVVVAACPTRRCQSINSTPVETTRRVDGGASRESLETPHRAWSCNQLFSHGNRLQLRVAHIGRSCQMRPLLSVVWCRRLLAFSTEKMIQ